MLPEPNNLACGPSILMLKSWFDLHSGAFPVKAVNMFEQVAPNHAQHCLPVKNRFLPEHNHSVCIAKLGFICSSIVERQGSNWFRTGEGHAEVMIVQKLPFREPCKYESFSVAINSDFFSCIDVFVFFCEATHSRSWMIHWMMLLGLLAAFANHAQALIESYRPEIEDMLRTTRSGPVHDAMAKSHIEHNIYHPNKTSNVAVFLRCFSNFAPQRHTHTHIRYHSLRHIGHATKPIEMASTT